MKLREHYQVNEIFTTVQGEGVLVGTPATFIRLQGCTVGCPWCDTKYTWAAGGERMPVRLILDQVTTKHVVVTGGEPTMYDLDGLLVPLQAERHVVQLETSGQNGIKGNVYPDWITWSPKENLGYKGAFDIKEHADEVKWVMDENLQWEPIQTLLDWYLKRSQADETSKMPWFVLMPEGCPPKPEMVEKTLATLRDLPRWSQTFFRYGDRIQYRIGVR